MVPEQNLRPGQALGAGFMTNGELCAQRNGMLGIKYRNQQH